MKGVTGEPLRILGKTWTEIGVGNKQISRQYLPVVPDYYLNSDLLLSCDILGQAIMTWCHPKRLLVWGGTPYVVNLVRRHRRQVERVIVVSPLSQESGVERKTGRLKSNVVLPPIKLV